MDEKDTMENRAEMESAEIRGEGMTGLANEAEQEAGVSVKPGENETGLADEARQEAEVPAPGESGSDLTADTSAVRRRQVKLLLLAVGAAMLLAVGLIVGSLVADHIRNQTNVWPIEVDWEVKAHPTEDEAFELNKWYQQLYEDDPTWEDRLGGAMFDANNVLAVYLVDGKGAETFRGKNVRLFGCKYSEKEVWQAYNVMQRDINDLGVYDVRQNITENVIDLIADPADRGRIPTKHLFSDAQEYFHSPITRVVYHQRPVSH